MQRTVSWKVTWQMQKGESQRIGINKCRERSENRDVFYQRQKTEKGGSIVLSSFHSATFLPPLLTFLLLCARVMSSILSVTLFLCCLERGSEESLYEKKQPSCALVDEGVYGIIFFWAK